MKYNWWQQKNLNGFCEVV